MMKNRKLRNIPTSYGGKSVGRDQLFNNNARMIGCGYKKKKSKMDSYLRLHKPDDIFFRRYSNFASRLMPCINTHIYITYICSL